MSLTGSTAEKEFNEQTKFDDEDVHLKDLYVKNRNRKIKHFVSKL